MGWERRGNNLYYYRKERQGSRVKPTYVGRGEIAHMVAQIQASSPLLERLARTIRSPEQVKLEEAEAALQNATHLRALRTLIKYASDFIVSWPKLIKNVRAQQTFKT